MTSLSLPEFQREIANRMGRGEWPAAAAAAAACRAAWPLDSTGWLLGSFVALLTDQKEAALALVEQRLAATPGDFPCLLQQGECLLALGRRAEALAAADAAVTAAGETPAALDAVGELLIHAGEHRRALEIYTRAIAAAPANRSLLAKRAEVYRFLGDFDLATLDYDAVLAIAPADAEALRKRVELRLQSVEDNSISAMEAALAVAPTDSTDVSALHFGLAKSYEDVGDYAASWRHVSAANRLERARLRFDGRQEEAVIGRIIEAFPEVKRSPPTRRANLRSSSSDCRGQARRSSNASSAVTLWCMPPANSRRCSKRSVPSSIAGFRWRHVARSYSPERSATSTVPRSPASTWRARARVAASGRVSSTSKPLTSRTAR